MSSSAMNIQNQDPLTTTNMTMMKKMELVKEREKAPDN